MGDGEKNAKITLVFLAMTFFSLIFFTNPFSGLDISNQKAEVISSDAVEIADDYSLAETATIDEETLVDEIEAISSGIGSNQVDIETSEDDRAGALQNDSVSRDDVSQANDNDDLNEEELPVQDDQADDQENVNENEPIKERSFVTRQYSFDTLSPVDIFISKRQKAKLFFMGSNAYIYFLTSTPAKINVSVKDANDQINNAQEGTPFLSSSFSLSHFIKIDQDFFSDGKNQITIKATDPQGTSYSQVIFFDYSEY